MRVSSRVTGNFRLAMSSSVLALAAASHTVAGMENPWTAHIRAVDDALAGRDAGLAVRAWQEAYVAALGSLHWEGMIDVGDAYLRIGEVSGHRQAAQAKARNSYLAALFRARQQESLEGVLRTADAFMTLGDWEVAEQCLKIARDLASRQGDAGAERQVRGLASRLAERAGAREP